MKLLNLGCGATRPKGDEWINLDDLHSQLPVGSGARTDLDKEPNYLNFDVNSGQFPFNEGTFDGILASHFFEHFDAQAGLKIMMDCKRVLKSGGVLLVSVPDASYFRKVYPEDRNENWSRLFETTDPKNPIPTFFEAALWFDQHKVILTEDALWAYFVRAGFSRPETIPKEITVEYLSRSIYGKLIEHLNRIPFSLIMLGVKE